MSRTLSRRAVLTAGAASIAALSLPRGAFGASASKFRYRDAIVIDGLGGPGGFGSPAESLLTDAELLDVRQSGLACLHTTVGVVGTTAPDEAFRETVQSISNWERQIDRHPDTLVRIRTAADIAAAKKAQRTGLIYGFQDGVAFETDLERLDTFHRLGVRVVQPTYNRRNLLGDGCLEPANAGLSITGHAAIERMNTLGILVDLSHCGRQTAVDAIRISKRPVAFTHTGCFALAEHPRNRTDAELRAVADKGGVSGVYFMPYLSGGKQPTAADVIRHLEHMINIAGEDHVSIGTDGGVSAHVLDDNYRKAFAEATRIRREAGIAAPQETEEGYLFAADLNTPRRFETLANMLTERGHTAARIEKILGANLVRVFADAWRPG